MNSELIAHSQSALKLLDELDNLRPYLDKSRPLPSPFIGSGKIRLVIIGQDPTVQLQASRDSISTVLNLNKNGSLRRFLQEVCTGLGLSLDENVYATNACKNFFVLPPTSIKSLDVLEASAVAWLPVLQYELEQFPNALVISLGQPVLSMLVKQGHHREMRYYWGHPDFSKDGVFTSIAVKHSTLDRRIFPMVHEKAWKSIEFYRASRARYLNYIRGFLID